ncbi:hypothetical protein ACO0R3_002604 [Hanseniaspora guilliermondii]
MSDSLNSYRSQTDFDREHSFLFGNADINEPDDFESSNDQLETTSHNHSTSSEDEDDEDNNPFKGTNHLYSEGLQKSLNNKAVTSRRNIISSNPNVRLPPSVSYISMPTLTPHDIEYLNNENIKELDQPLYTSKTYHGQASNDGFGQYSFIKSKEEEIKIIYAGKFQFADGKIAIGYTILYNNQKITRRYTDFVNLRQILKKMLPTCIIPPIPERHNLFSYILQPFHFSFNYNKSSGSRKFLDESDDTLLKRSRQFQMFLNLCLTKSNIRECIVFKRFIDADFANWVTVMNQPPVSILPESNLQAPPLDPIKPSPLHLLLPLPKRFQLNYKSKNNPKLNDDSEIDKDLSSIEHLESFNKFYIDPAIKIYNNFKSHLESAVDYIAELGGYYNVSSIETQFFNFHQNLTEEEYGLQDHSMNASILSTLDRRHEDGNRDGFVSDDALNIYLEKIGQIYDSNYVATQFLANDLNISIKEHLEMLSKYNEETISLIHFRQSKIMQKKIVEENHFVLREKLDFLRKIQTLDKTDKKETTAADVTNDLEEGQLSADISCDASEISISNQDESLDTSDGNKTDDFVESVLMKNKGNSKAIQAAINQYKIQKRQNAYKKVISETPLEKKDTKKKKKSSMEHSVISREKLDEEIEEVSKKLSHMTKLKELATKDVNEVNREFEKECDLQSKIYDDIWNKDILSNVEASVYAWANENLSHWEKFLSEIDI